MTKPTGKVPSLGRAVYDGFWALAALVATVWVGWGMQTPRETTGFILGLGLLMALTMQSVGALIERHTAVLKARREALEARFAEPDHEVIAAWERRRRLLYKPGPY